MQRHIYIGFDAIDHLAYRVCEASMLKQAVNGEIQIHPLRDWQLRGQGYYWRKWQMLNTGQKQDVKDESFFSTEFSYTRFLTPIIHNTMKRTGPCIFMDADMMLRGDINELLDMADDSFDVQCVKHIHTPSEDTKIVGITQQQYDRKNWSSVMLFPDSRRINLSIEDVNTKHRDWLHGMKWASKIGGLPEEWNWLDGWSSENIDPKIVHHTRGTPDMPNWDHVAFSQDWWDWAKDAGYLGQNEL